MSQFSSPMKALHCAVGSVNSKDTKLVHAMVNTTLKPTLQHKPQQDGTINGTFYKRMNNNKPHIPRKAFPNCQHLVTPHTKTRT